MWYEMLLSLHMMIRNQSIFATYFSKLWIDILFIWLLFDFHFHHIYSFSCPWSLIYMYVSQKYCPLLNKVRCTPWVYLYSDFKNQSQWRDWISWKPSFYHSNIKLHPSSDNSTPTSDPYQTIHTAKVGKATPSLTYFVYFYEIIKRFLFWYFTCYHNCQAFILRW